MGAILLHWHMSVKEFCLQLSRQMEVRDVRREKLLQKSKAWLLHNFTQDQPAWGDAENQKDQEA